MFLDPIHEVPWSSSPVHNFLNFLVKKRMLYTFDHFNPLKFSLIYTSQDLYCNSNPTNSLNVWWCWQFLILVLYFFNGGNKQVNNIIECFGHWQFLFYFILFFWFHINFTFLFFLILDNEVAHDTAITWHITWCNIIDLEHSERIWKITSRYMYTTWWSWVKHKANMRIKHGYESRFNYYSHGPYIKHIYRILI